MSIFSSTGRPGKRAKDNIRTTTNWEINEFLRILQAVSFEKKLRVTETTCVVKPVFQSDELAITFDAIEISPHPDLPNKLGYLPIEIIPGAKVSKTDKLAFAVNCLLASQVRSFTPESGKLIYGQDLTATKITLADYAKEARKVVKELAKMLNSQDAPRFYQNPHCRICEFQAACKARLFEKDDLSLLGGMSPKQVRKQNNKGIFTVLQFAYTFRPRKRKKAADKPKPFEWALKALALQEKQTYLQKIPELPEAPTEMYLDFESLPDENFVDLIGLLIKEGETERYLSFWADSEQDEERIFRQLFETVSSFEDFTIYHYGSYELHALKRFNKKFENVYERDITLINEHAVNVLPFFTSAVYPPTYTNELKDIARFLGFAWSAQDASGMQSIAWRKRWELSRDAAYKDKLMQYNIEGCLALKLVKEWLANIGKKLEHKENNRDFVNVEDVKIRSLYKFGKNEYQIPDFETITKYAYFDYQREKIYVKTNKSVKKALKKKIKKSKTANKIDKTVRITFSGSCPK